MSNIRLNTIVPDVVNNASGIITLPGILSVSGFTATSVLDASSPSTAGVTFLGGVGIAKSISLGGNISFANGASTAALISQNTAIASDNKGIVLAGGGAQGSARGASLELYGNQMNSGEIRLTTGSAGSLRISTGGNAVDSVVLSPSGTLTLNATATSTSASTGALILSSGGLTVNSTANATDSTNGGAATIAGGLAVGKSIFVGETLTTVGAFTSNAGISVTATTDASGLATGSVYTLGGASVSKSIYVGGAANLMSTLSVMGTAAFTSTADPAVTFSGGISVAKSCTVSGQLNASSAVVVAGILTSTNTTDSTGITNGAMVISGGLGLGGALRTGGNIYTNGALNQTNAVSASTFAGTVSFTNTTDAVAVGSGALTVSGGMSVAQSARFGGNVFVTGTTTHTGAVTFSSSITTTGDIVINSTTTSSTPTNGSLIVSGGLGLSGALNSAGVVTLSNTTDSSSISTGTLILSNGGLGVSRSVFIGNTLNVASTSNFAGNVTASGISMTGALVNTNATASTSPTTGSAIFSGGVGISGAIYIGGNLAVTGTSNFVGNTTYAGIMTMTNATESNSLSSGSFVTSGGIAIAKSIQVGWNATIAGTTTVSGQFVCLNTTSSTSSTTGAAVVSGGFGIGGNLNVGSALTCTGAASVGSTLSVTGVATFNNSTEATNGSTGSIISSGGIAVGKSVYVGLNLTVPNGTTNLSTVTVSGPATFTNVAESSSYSTGSVVISGGLGVAKNITCNANLTVAGASSFVGTSTFTNATDSSNATTGSVIYSGGVGIARNLNVGGGFSVAAAATFGGLISNPGGAFSLNTVTMVDSSGMLYIRTPTPSIRLAATDALKTTPYTATFDLFSLGNTYLDANYESLQVTTTGSNAYSILTRAAGTGIVRRLILSTRDNVNQLTLNTDGTVSVGSSTLDTSSPTSGSVTVSGGLGIARSVSVGKSWSMYGSTSGSVTLTAPATVTPYTLVLPNAVSPAANYALVSDTFGNLGWAQMTTSNPTFQSVAITNTTASTGTTSGALTVAGGLGVGGAGYVGGNLNLTGGSGANMIVSNVNGLAAPSYNSRSLGTRFVLYPNITTTTADYAIGIEDGFMWFSADRPTVSGFKWYSGTNNTLTLDYAGNLSLFPGGKLTFAGSTSGTMALKPPGAITSYTLTLPNALPSSANYALVSDTSGNLSWSQMVTPNPTFNTVTISATTDTSAFNTGALIVAGGGSFASGLAVKNKLKLVAPTSGTVTITVPDNNGSPTFTLPSTLPNQPGQFLQASQTGVMNWATVPTTSSYTAHLANNVTTPTSISGLMFPNMFKIDVYVSVVTTTTTYGAMYTLRGFQSSGGWTLYENYAGDDTGVDFTINSSTGQIMYTSTNVANWTDGTAAWTGPNIYSTPPGGIPQQASGANNQTAPANVTGLIMSPPQFASYVLVTVNNSTVANSTVSLYLIQGTLQQSGTWSFGEQVVSGPDPGIHFSILSNGQVQYTSPNISGWLSTTFQFYGPAIPLQNAANYAKMSLTGGEESTSLTTGDLQVVGGAAVTKTLTVGSGVVAPNMISLRNKVINADMYIDQRGNAGGVTGINVYPADRWRCDHGFANTPVFSRPSVTGLNGFLYALMVKIAAVAESSSAVEVNPHQRIEGHLLSDLQWGTAYAKSATVSFWVRASVTGTFVCTLQSASFDLSYVATYTIAAANTWQFVRFTVPGPTGGTWNLATNSVGCYLLFPLHGSGTARATSNGNTWVSGDIVEYSGMVNLGFTPNATFYVTGVQFEKGVVASPFEFRPYPFELQLCQRYYERTTMRYIGMSFNSGYLVQNWFFKVTKRAPPSTFGIISSSGLSGTPTLEMAQIDSISITSAATANTLVQGTVVAEAASEL